MEGGGGRWEGKWHTHGQNVSNREAACRGESQGGAAFVGIAYDTAPSVVASAVPKTP